MNEEGLCIVHSTVEFPRSKCGSIDKIRLWKNIITFKYGTVLFFKAGKDLLASKY